MITKFQLFETIEDDEKSYQDSGIFPEAGDYLTVAFQTGMGEQKVGIMYIKKVFRVSFDWNWVGQMGKIWEIPHTMRSRFDSSVLGRILYHGKDIKKATEASDAELAKLRFDL